MIDAFSEFLNENAQRNYPFVPDAVLLDDSLTFEIPENLLLDYRGFHRARNEIKPRLAAIVGPTAGVNATYPTHTGFVSLYFEMGPVASPLRILVSIDVNTIAEVFEVYGSVLDPFYSGINLGTVRVTIGAGWKTISGGDRWIYSPLSALLEPALTIESYRSQIDYLRIIHQEGDTEFLRGDVMIYGGYNMSVIPQGSNSIYFSAELGAGELGRFTDQLRDSTLEYCNSAVMFLSGVGPNDVGKMTFEEGQGIKITGFPDLHKIQMSVSPASLQRPLCA